MTDWCPRQWAHFRPQRGGPPSSSRPPFDSLLIAAAVGLGRAQSPKSAVADLAAQTAAAAAGFGTIQPRWFDSSPMETAALLKIGLNRNFCTFVEFRLRFSDKG